MRNLKIPSNANPGMQVEVVVTLGQGGKIGNVKIKRSSGSRSFDRSA